MLNNYCIYKHTNLINGKVYIGQTCQSPEKRFGKNGNGYRGCRYFYNAIECYGWDNFEHEILETNLKDIENELCINPYNISRCISGKLDTYKGFIWKYE